ncbi:DNA polymerase III subunit epsilon [Corynebacterium sp. TAE3-ERU2]|uniref:DNA polymerase III subunit epsilon n=1 Tax=Corynebacterium sp. TAE3-ERU2 TaxID=2849497 RepID=UPI001C4500D1|nr:DNA polymerase III subunit epsilon [Corynebacterium sp. TAE3-ERU2]MBV7302450.1 DNA polymerase III subunit epsilon [Corynebacterium sp. TAE3-ERU2]
MSNGNHHLSREERRARRQAELERAPFVVATVQTSGIHPASARMVAIDLATFTPSGELDEHVHHVLNPKADPGPPHLHGLSKEEVAAAPTFAGVAKSICRMIDGRTLITFDMALTWGFIVSESKRAIAHNRRAHAPKQRRRRGGKRNRSNFGHVPKPVALIDMLTTVRRTGATIEDERLRGVARQWGLFDGSPQASRERASVPEADFSFESTQLTWDLYAAIDNPVSYKAEELKADRCGLQRTVLRVDAAQADAAAENPGAYQPGGSLQPGMEVVLTPQIELPDTEIIQAALDAGLSYSEKLGRGSSLVICNHTQDLKGKAMHAQRKNIPLMADTAFVELARQAATAAEN